MADPHELEALKARVAQLEHEAAARQRELERANHALEARVAERTAELERQCAMLRGIVDSAAAPIFAVDRAYRFTSFNQRFAASMAALHGADVAVGVCILDQLPLAADRAAAQRNLDRALAGETFTDERFTGEADPRYDRVAHHPIRDAVGDVIGVAVFGDDLTDRRRAEQQLREREQRYRDIFDNVVDGIFLIDVLADGRFRTVEVNPALERMTGIPRAASIGRTQDEAVDPATAAIVDGKYRRCVEEGRPLEEEVALELPVGRRYFQSSLIPARDQDGRVTRIVGITRDVTERRQAEEERRANLRFLEGVDRVNRAIQSAHDLDAMTSDVLDVVREWLGCDRVFLVHPCDPDAATWRAPMERTGPAFPGVRELGIELPVDAEVAATFRVLLAADGPVTFGPGAEHALPAEVAARFGFQSLLSMAIYPRVGRPWQFGVHQCTHVRQWTAEERALLNEVGRRLADGLTSLVMRRDLVASEAKYRRIVDTATEGIWVVGPDQETEFINARMADLLGCTPEEVVGRPPTDFLVAEDLPDHDRLLAGHRAGAAASYERRLRRKDGAVLWTQVSATPVFDARHRFAGTFAMFTDTTARKHAELELRRLNRELRAVGNCHQTLLRATDEQDLLAELCRIVVEQMGYLTAAVVYLDRDPAGPLRVVAEAGRHQACACGDLDQPAIGDAAREGRTVIVQDLAGAAPPASAGAPASCRAAIWLPLVDEQRAVFGVFHICAADVDAFSAEEVVLLEELAEDMAFGVTVLRGRAQRRAAERSLALLSFALNNVKQAAFLIDERAAFHYTNDAADRLVGYPPGALLGRMVADIDPDFPEARWPQHWQDLQTHRALIFEGRHRTKDGRLVPVEINANYFEYEGQGYNLALTHDITDRKQAEQALRDTASRLSEAQRIAHLGSWELDLTTHALRWSDEIFRIFEIDPQRFPATYEAFLAAIHPDDRAAVDAAYTASLRDRVPYTIDHRLRMPDGRIKYVHEQCETFYDGDRPLRSVGTIQDVTERKAADLALREREAFIRRILDSVDDGIVVVDRDYRIRAANRAYLEAVQLAEAQVVGRRCDDVSHHVGRPCWESDEAGAVRRTLQTGAPHAAAHADFDAAGVRRDVEIRSYPITDAHGNVDAVIETITDVTARRRLEEQLRQAQKMEAIGTLAGGVAHDFNNLLTAIIGYANLVQVDMDPADPSCESVAEILAASDKAAQLTRGLLAFSRKQAMNLKSLDLNDVVRSVEKLLRRLLGEDIDLSTTLAPGDLIVTADAGQLEQVLMNLAVNARDAMPKGGVLAITTRRYLQVATDGDAGEAARPGPYAQLTVVDTGTGMDAQVRAKVFEPFFTTKEQGKGTGLGLAIVYGIVEQHGGTISVHSEPGRGTTFKVLLPLVAVAPVAEPAKVLAPPARGTETILLAEDDGAVRTLLASVLRGHGYQVIEAHDGADALAQYAAHRAAIDALILDVVMPRQSGREVYDAVRADRADVRVLFVSGYTGDIIEDEAILDEGLHFLAKPLRPFELLRTLRAILDGPR